MRSCLDAVIDDPTFRGQDDARPTNQHPKPRQQARAVRPAQTGCSYSSEAMVTLAASICVEATGAAAATWRSARGGAGSQA
jgi:hypothetical protein